MKKQSNLKAAFSNLRQFFGFSDIHHLSRNVEHALAELSAIDHKKGNVHTIIETMISSHRHSELKLKFQLFQIHMVEHGHGHAFEALYQAKNQLLKYARHQKKWYFYTFMALTMGILVMSAPFVSFLTPTLTFALLTAVFVLSVIDLMRNTHKFTQVFKSMRMLGNDIEPPQHAWKKQYAQHKSALQKLQSAGLVKILCIETTAAAIAVAFAAATLIVPETLALAAFIVGLTMVAFVVGVALYEKNMHAKEEIMTEAAQHNLEAECQKLLSPVQSEALKKNQLVAKAKTNNVERNNKVDERETAKSADDKSEGPQEMGPS